MGGADRQGQQAVITDAVRGYLLTHKQNTGGKAKPLKAAKKQNKELDEDDLAFIEKKRAGKSSCLPSKSYPI